MATIVTRSGKGSPLTNNEVDANFTNLNTDKLESGDTAASLTITSADINGGTIDGVTIGGSSAGAITGTTGQFNTSLNVDGTATVDELTVDRENLTDLKTWASSDVGSIAFYQAQNYPISNGYYRVLDINAGAGNAGSIIRLLTQEPSSSSRQRILIDQSGDISFYEDTGTTAKFFWDASAESLGIGASPSTHTLEVWRSGGDHLLLGRSGVGTYELGVSTDNALTFEDGGTERLRIDSSGNVGIGNTVASTIDTASGYGTLTVGTGSGEHGVTVYGATGALAFADGTTTTSTYEGYLAYVHSDNSLRVGTSATERMRIDSSGNVGIGTTSPSSLLNISAASPIFRISNTGTTGDGLIHFGDSASNFSGVIQYNHTSDYMAIYTNANERMRIDSSGNLLVGTPSSNAVGVSSGGTSTGVEFQGDGEIQVGSDGDKCAIFNRQSSDGEIIRFRKDGATVGSIGASGGDMFAGTGDTGLRFVDADDAIVPWNTSTNAGRDNAVDLGKTSERFDDIYATNGTIQTSDRNEKENIRELLEAEARVAQAAKGLLRAFQWKDSVAEKGDDARIHFGIIAQDLQAAFEAEGLDAGRYAMFIHSTWTDEETGEERSRMGVRYSELLAFIIAAL